VDPLAEPQISWSTYHYVYNNPLKFFDPFGLMGRMAGADGLTNEQWIESSRPGADPNAARRYRNENRLAEANLSRFHSWFDDTYVWNPYAGEEIGRETLGGALRLSFSGGYTLRQGGYLPRSLSEFIESPHAVSVSFGAALGGGFGLEIGKVYDGRGGSAWFFRSDARIGLGGGVSVNYEEIKSARGLTFEVEQWRGYDNYWGIGIGPITYGQGENQEVWGRDGDRWFNPNAMSGQGFTYRGGSIGLDFRRPGRYGPITRNPKGGRAFEIYKSWGKTFLWGIK
jgi:hypothetical protein